MPKKLLHEMLTQVFSAYASDDFNEKYHSFMERYSPEQRLDLQMLYCAEVDNLILRMTRINDQDLGKEILAGAPEMIQCLFILRYIAILKFLIYFSGSISTYFYILFLTIF